MLCWVELIFSGKCCSKYLRRQDKHSDETFTESVRHVSLDRSCVTTQAQAFQACEEFESLGHTGPAQSTFLRASQISQHCILQGYSFDRALSIKNGAQMCACGCSSCRNPNTSGVYSLRNRGAQMRLSSPPPSFRAGDAEHPGSCCLCLTPLGNECLYCKCNLD